MKRISHPTFTYEKSLWEKGYCYVAGIDEVGRGAFAGPVVVASVVFDREKRCPKDLAMEINDSKKLTPGTRERLSKEVKRFCLTYSISTIPVSVINTQGIGKATYRAFRKAISEMRKYLPSEKLFVLVDGFYIPYMKGIGIKNQQAIIKGDSISVSIAAASILAKVHRDSLMKKLHLKYAQYNFAQNKGYGTLDHRQKLKQFGLSKVHRLSFNLSPFLNTAVS